MSISLETAPPALWLPGQIPAGRSASPNHSGSDAGEVLLISKDRGLRDELLKSGLPIDWQVTSSIAPDLIGISYELALLDLDLVRGDWLGWLKAVRRKGHGGHIVLLSSVGTREQRIDAFDGGADAYVAKPYLIEEVMAWVRALLRRPTAIRYHRVHRHITVNLLTSAVTRDGHPVSLPPTALSLLKLLLANRCRVVSHATIARRVFDEELAPRVRVSIESYVYRLRQELDIDGGSSVIRTIRGCGYALQ